MKRINRYSLIQNTLLGKITTDESNLTDSFYLVGAPLARLVQLRQLHPLEDTQNLFNPLNRLLILRTLTSVVICDICGRKYTLNLWIRN